MIKKLQYFYYYIRLLSIDIVLGVLAGGIYAVKIFNISVPLVFWLLLPATVWFIYIADHLTDGLKAAFKPVSAKYRFYLVHAKTFLYTLLFIFLFNIVLFIVYLGHYLRIFGVVAAFLVLIYFAVHNLSGKNNRYFMQKEILIALVYTFGIFGAPLWISGKIEPWQVLILTGYMAMALANVLICSLYDVEADKAMNQSSMATRKGTRLTRLAIALVLICSYIISFLMAAIFHYYFYAILHFSISSIFLLLLLIPSKVPDNELYGIITDAAFFLPALVLLKI